MPDYGKQWHYDRSRGVHRGYIDATPVREHVAALVAEGWTTKGIARTAGSSDTALHDLMAGRTARVQQATARRVLTVDRDTLYATASRADLVPAIGYLRRGRALTALGWSTRSLETQGCGLDIRGKQVWAVRWRRMRDLYDELSSTPGSSVRSVQAAARNGWAAPGWWDDDIDDPGAAPHVDSERPRVIDALVEDVTTLISAGETLAGIACRLGRREDSLLRALQRAGRHDLARRMTEVAS